MRLVLAAALVLTAGCSGGGGGNAKGDQSWPAVDSLYTINGRFLTCTGATSQGVAPIPLGGEYGNQTCYWDHVTVDGIPRCHAAVSFYQQAALGTWQVYAIDKSIPLSAPDAAACQNEPIWPELSTLWSLQGGVPSCTGTYEQGDITFPEWVGVCWHYCTWRNVVVDGTPRCQVSLMFGVPVVYSNDIPGKYGRCEGDFYLNNMSDSPPLMFPNAEQCVYR